MKTRLNDQVAFRIPHSLRPAIERAARAKKVTLAEFCRDAVLEAVQAVVVAADKRRNEPALNIRGDRLP